MLVTMFDQRWTDRVFNRSQQQQRRPIDALHRASLCPIMLEIGDLEERIARPARDPPFGIDSRRQRSARSRCDNDPSLRIPRDRRARC